MRKMKDSGIAWIGEIPEGYSLSRLKYFIKFINGYAFDSNEFSTGSGIPVIRIGDIAAKIDFNQCVKVVPNIKYNSFLVEKYDILLAMSGATFGKTALLHDKTQAYINQRVGIIRSNANNYFYYLFNIAGFFEYLRYTFMGSAQPNISGEDIKNYTFLNLPNKKQIADFLDKKCAEIDKLIELQESMIEKLKEYKQSVITQAVTKGLDPDVPMKDSGIEWIGKIPTNWQIIKLKQVALLKTGHTPTTKDERNFDGEINWYTPGDFERNTINISARSITNYAVEKDEIKLFPKGSTLLVCIGATAGKAAKITKEGYSNQQITAIIGIEIDKNYLFYTMLIAGKVLEKNALFTTLPIINNSYLSAFVIPHVPIEMQQQIADYLDKKCAEIDDLIKLKEQKIEKLKEYKKSLIYEYVTGKKEVC